MYTIDRIEKNGLNYIVVKGAKTYAEICLDRGAALETWESKSNVLIEDLSPMEYSSTYASSILFPFANRIKDGTYTYKGQEFKFKCNEANLNNALHGLVFNKTFHLVESDADANGAALVLKYEETSKIEAFPYLYTVLLKFVFTNDGLILQMKVENNDVNGFPFTLGWHPYFVCKDLSKSTLEFSSSKAVEFDERMITKGITETTIPMPFEIKQQQLDNCYVLKEGSVVFNTPSYKMTIESDADENYFQVYTPPRANTIALEPVTGVSNSFNNQYGVKELIPGETYGVVWKITVE